MSETLKIKFIYNDFDVTSIDSPIWETAEKVSLNKYWSGERAPEGRQADVRILWSSTSLYVRFEGNQLEPLVINQNPDRSRKTEGLWNRDVCEIFVAPNLEEPNRYFEFEVAPTGEWVDLEIHQTPDKRETNLEYHSGMKTSMQIESGKVFVSMKIEWNAFGKTPKAGEKWRGNLFRILGEGETRGYLSWQPTETEKPNFHVPEKFGEFEFVL